MAEETLGVTQTGEDPILSVDEFATKLKTKYPEYKDIDNKLLVGKMLTKYPQYSSRVSMGDDIAKKPSVTASNNGGQQSSNGGQTDQPFPTVTNPSNSGLDYAPLTSPAKQEQLAKDTAVREARQQEQNKVSQSLSKIYKQLPADSKKGWDKAMQLSAYRMEHPDTLTEPTQEEREHQDFMNTTTGKVLGTVAYLGSKATKGTLQIAKGAAWLADNTIGLGSDKSLSDETEKLDKYTDVGLTKSDIYQKEQGKSGKILSNLGGLVEFAPAILTGGATSEAATFALQGFGQGKETIDQAEKNSGTKLSPTVKNLFVLGSGTVNALLMGDLGKGIIGKLPATLRRDIVSDITANALKEAAGKELTGEAFKALLEDGAKKLGDKVTKFGINALTGYKKAVVDLSSLSGANYILKKGVDVVSDKPVFNESLGDLAGQVSSIATEQAPFFAAAGVAGQLGKLTPYSSYKNDVVESLMADPSEANADAIKQQLYDHGFNHPREQWSPEDMDATFKQVDNVASIAKRLPRNIKPSKLTEAVDLINGKDELQKRLQEIQGAKTDFDESVKDIPTKEEQLVQDKIDQANDKLQSIVGGKDVKYIADEERGIYTKVLPNGESVKISKERYDLEQLEREAKRRERDEQVSKFQQKFPDYSVNVMDDLPDHLGRTFDRIESNKPTDIVAVNEASDWLYNKYKQLESIKDSDTRRMTTDQINDIMGQLEKDITTLENYKKQNHPDAEPTTTEQTTTTNEQGTVNTPTEVQPQQAEAQQHPEASADNNQVSVETNIKQQPPAVEQPPTKRNPTKYVDAAKNENINAKAEQAGVELGDTVGETRGNSLVNKEARQAIKSGYDPRELTEKILKDNHQASDTEVAILAKHIDVTEKRLTDINKRIEAEGATLSKAEFDDLANERTRALSEFQDAAQAARKTGTRTARALSARRFEVTRDYSLANMITRKREANGGDKLSVSQLEDVTKRFEELEAAQKAYESKIAELEGKVKDLKANQSVKMAAERIKRKSVSKAELKEERSKIITDFRVELAKIRKTTSAVAVPYARELAAAVPFAVKMVRNLALEGVVEIKDVIDRVHDEFKSDIPNLTKNDVRDILAGVYNEAKPTRNELENQVRSLKSQAQLLRKIEQLEKGIKPEKNGSPTPKNEKVEALKKQLRELEKQNDIPKEEKDLNAYKKRITDRIAEVNKRITDKDYSKAEKNETKLDAESLKLRREYDRLKHEYDIDVEKDKLANRKKAEKIKDNFLNILSLPRALKATLDFSAVLRQGLILGVGHPTKAVTALKEMFGQTFSETKYKNWLYDIKHSEHYDLMQKSDLYISDKTSPELLAKEEEFTSNLAERIPVFGRLVAGSERAYSAYLNALRTGVFIGEAAKLMDRGYTFDSDPEVFKGIAKVVNVLSGRGDIPEFLGGKQPAVLSNLLFSPRFMASRIQTLYMWADRRLPREARALAAKDIGALIGTAAVVISIAQLAGLTVEKDPRSSDFLKLRDGDTRYDILGGLSPYVVFLAKELSGKKKPTTNTGMVTLGAKKFGSPTRLSEAMQFSRGKLSPLVGSGINLMDNKDLVGQEYNLYPQAIPGEFVPLPYKDITEAYKMGGWENALKVLIPSQFGIGVSTYSNSKSGSGSKHYTYTR